MMMSNQHQKGGDDSTNIQTQSMVVNIGIDEKRAREIYQEMNLQLRSDYSQEALNIAKARVAEFENKLMPKMIQIEGALEAFSDPSFQLLLVEAQKTAAATERSGDYDLLSELLIHRVQKGGNRTARAGISLAVDIVDKISDEALLGLTAMHAVNSFTPLSGDIHQGLDVLNDLFGKIFYQELPNNRDWLDHLDILNAVRLNPFGSLKKISQYYPEQLPGYVDVGIRKNSEDHNKAIEILKNNSLPTQILVEHAFNNDFIRLCICNIKNIDEIYFSVQMASGSALIYTKMPLIETQKDAIISIYELYSNDANIRQSNVNSLISEWNKRPHLKVLMEWWDNISGSATITSVGKVLAHSNAQRCDRSLPPLD